jgi:hypothetical protein
MGLPFVPPLRFIAISSFIQCYLFYVHRYEKSCFIISSQLHLFSIESLVHCVRTCTMCMSCLSQKMRMAICCLLYLFYVRLIGVLHNVFTFILSTGTCVMSKLDMDMYIV